MQKTYKFYVYVANNVKTVLRIHSGKNAVVEENLYESLFRVVVTSGPRHLIRTQITDVTRKIIFFNSTTITTTLTLTLSKVVRSCRNF